MPEGDGWVVIIRNSFWVALVFIIRHYQLIAKRGMMAGREFDFIVGQEYRRKTDIHEKFGGQRQGGISTPADYPAVFIFTSDAGEAFGYQDGFTEDGTFWYTGEGQVGHMEMAKGNRAILDHAKNQKVILLFEYTRKAHVRFIGAAKCLGHHEEQRPDKNKALRTVFIFHLDVDSIEDPSAEVSKGDAATDLKSLEKKSLSDLRTAALRRVNKTATVSERKSIARYRSQALKEYVVKRSKGVCEGCRNPAPFNTRSGPFLECHHVHRLSDGGPDLPENVVALCPNCHRRAHYASDAKAFNESLKRYAAQVEGQQQ